MLIKFFYGAADDSQATAPISLSTKTWDISLNFDLCKAFISKGRANNKYARAKLYFD